MLSVRFPYVSRLALDLQTERLHELRVECDRAVERFAAELEREQARSAQLLELVLAFKTAGAVIDRPRTTRGISNVEPTPRSAIQQAIDENKYASRNPRLRAHLATWGADQIAKRPHDVLEDVWEDRVLARLRTWSAVSAADDDDSEDGDDGDADEMDDEVIAV